VKEELSRRTKKESRRALQKRHPRRGITVGLGVVHKRGSSFVPSLQEVWKTEVLCER